MNVHVSFDDAQLERLAELIAERLRRGNAEVADGWLDAKAAAEYLGLPSVDALHKLTATRVIPFTQDRPGAKLYFRRGDLDAWRARGRRGPP